MNRFNRRFRYASAVVTVLLAISACGVRTDEAKAGDESDQAASSVVSTPTRVGSRIASYLGTDIPPSRWAEISAPQ